MDDEQLRAHIGELVAEQKSLRDAPDGLDAAGRARMRALEEKIDQQWDLLRQREAKEEFHEDPNQAQTRPVDEVERYQQ